MRSAIAAISPYFRALIVSGIGKGIVWTGTWIAAASGVHHDEQGDASGMASTTLSVGNAIDLAVLIAVANRHVGGPEGNALRSAAVGILISLFTTFALPAKAEAAAE